MEEEHLTVIIFVFSTLILSSFLVSAPASTLRLNYSFSQDSATIITSSAKNCIREIHWLHLVVTKFERFSSWIVLFSYRVYQSYKQEKSQIVLLSCSLFNKEDVRFKVGCSYKQHSYGCSYFSCTYFESLALTLILFFPQKFSRALLSKSWAFLI